MLYKNIKENEIEKEVLKGFPKDMSEPVTYSLLKAKVQEAIKLSSQSKQKDVLRIIDEWEKENTLALKTKDIIKGKIIIADYVKWDKIKELKKRIEQKSVKTNKDNKITKLDHEWLGTSV